VVGGGVLGNFTKIKNKNKNQWAICKALLGVTFWRQITRKQKHSCTPFRYHLNNYDHKIRYNTFKDSEESF
jgi:hypothetical protein